MVAAIFTFNVYFRNGQSNLKLIANFDMCNNHRNTYILTQCSIGFH